MELYDQDDHKEAISEIPEEDSDVVAEVLSDNSLEQSEVSASNQENTEDPDSLLETDDQEILAALCLKSH